MYAGCAEGGEAGRGRLGWAGLARTTQAALHGSQSGRASTPEPCLSRPALPLLRPPPPGGTRGYQPGAASHVISCKWHLPIHVKACINNAKASRYPLRPPAGTLRMGTWSCSGAGAEGGRRRRRTAAAAAGRALPAAWGLGSAEARSWPAASTYRSMNRWAIAGAGGGADSACSWPPTHTRA